MWVFPFSASAMLCLSHSVIGSFLPPERADPGQPEPAHRTAEGTAHSGPGSPPCWGSFCSVCPSSPCPKDPVICSGAWVGPGSKQPRTLSQASCPVASPGLGCSESPRGGGQALAPSWVSCGQLSHTCTHTHLFWLFITFIFGCTWSSCCEHVWAFSGCDVRASHRADFSCCGAEARGSWAAVAVAHGLFAPRHVGSSRTRG